MDERKYNNEGGVAVQERPLNDGAVKEVIKEKKPQLTVDEIRKRLERENEREQRIEKINATYEKFNKVNEKLNNYVDRIDRKGKLSVTEVEDLNIYINRIIEDAQSTTEIGGIFGDQFDQIIKEYENIQIKINKPDSGYFIEELKIDLKIIKERAKKEIENTHSK